MDNFIYAASPWIIIGMAVVTLFAIKAKRKNDSVKRENYMTEGFEKYIKAVCAGVLGIKKDSLYIQTRNRGCCAEAFIPFEDNDCYNVREPW